MKYLAIDYGQKRIGVAASDDGGNIAFPRITLHKTTKDMLFAQLLDLITKDKIEALVVGLPVPDDGVENLTTKQVRNFTESLKRRVELPIFFMPETLSSFAADQSLRSAGLYSQDRNKYSDQAAAVEILNSFLSLPSERRIKA
ncbi:Holliday junction resolvase RuvX [Desulfovibrio litoralis]|uniref:Putative pre-16S rRNA nuclease n=1 Tax=Desulfovibrio litoralis DSM 11393 TaxID=1121455 RepID=A0A1M7SA74_9BACT|nr:Holliday junction resolvase RuvX [Desulfovibrio litoralis]SHN55318.1 putative holliday junction resolvase [Desulfovibrio litoralis DSM 11393]